MTVFIEQPSDGVFAFDDFGAVGPLSVGDSFSGVVSGRVIVPDTPVLTIAERDGSDTASFDVNAGETYTFTLNWAGDAVDTSLTFSAGGVILGSDFIVDRFIDPDSPDGIQVTFLVPTGVTSVDMEIVGAASREFLANQALGYTVTVDNIISPFATDGDDVIVGADAPTVLDLMDGNDTWTGQDDLALFAVGQFIDTINGGFGDDSIFGGLGNDALFGDQDNDLLDGGDGNDNAWGGEGDDVLFGGTGIDRLNGNSGHDSLFGGKGGDILQGGKGEDYIEGGNQADKIYGGNQADEIYGGTGNDTIMGGNGQDLIFGGSGGDRIVSGRHDDVVYGGHGADRINAGSGNDTVYGDQSNDRLNGNSGDDDLFGGSGNDLLTGGSGNDALYGGGQNDRLNGATGADLLEGGLGNDQLTGGEDSDVFVFSGIVNDDTITDFELGADKIDLAGYGPMTADDVTGMISDVVGNAAIDLGQYGEVVLLGVSAEDLTIENFLYLPDDIFVVG